MTILHFYWVLQWGWLLGMSNFIEHIVPVIRSEWDTVIEIDPSLHEEMAIYTNQAILVYTANHSHYNRISPGVPDLAYYVSFTITDLWVSSWGDRTPTDGAWGTGAFNRVGVLVRRGGEWCWTQLGVEWVHWVGRNIQCWHKAGSHIFLVQYQHTNILCCYAGMENVSVLTLHRWLTVATQR